MKTDLTITILQLGMSQLLNCIANENITIYCHIYILSFDELQLHVDDLNLIYSELRSDFQTDLIIIKTQTVSFNKAYQNIVCFYISDKSKL